MQEYPIIIIIHTGILKGVKWHFPFKFGNCRGRENISSVSYNSTLNIGKHIEEIEINILLDHSELVLTVCLSLKSIGGTTESQSVTHNP